MSKLSADNFGSRSHLFMLRVWLEDLGAGEVEWRGKLQHVATGETGYFRDWDGLTAFLVEMLAPAQSSLDNTKDSE